MNWPNFPRVERRACRLREMMHRVGVDTVALATLRGGDAYREARTRCLFCGTSDKCVRWLEEPANANSKPTFCPNMRLFETCQRVQEYRFSST